MANSLPLILSCCSVLCWINHSISRTNKCSFLPFSLSLLSQKQAKLCSCHRLCAGRLKKSSLYSIILYQGKLVHILRVRGPGNRFYQVEFLLSMWKKQAYSVQICYIWDKSASSNVITIVLLVNMIFISQQIFLANLLV